MKMPTKKKKSPFPAGKKGVNPFAAKGMVKEAKGEEKKDKAERMRGKAMPKKKSGKGY